MIYKFDSIGQFLLVLISLTLLFYLPRLSKFFVSIDFIFWLFWLLVEANVETISRESQQISGLLMWHVVNSGWYIKWWAHMRISTNLLWKMLCVCVWVCVCVSSITHVKNGCCRGCGWCLFWAEPSDETTPALYDSSSCTLLWSPQEDGNLC